MQFGNVTFSGQFLPQMYTLSKTSDLPEVTFNSYFEGNVTPSTFTQDYNCSTCGCVLSGRVEICAQTLGLSDTFYTTFNSPFEGSVTQSTFAQEPVNYSTYGFSETERVKVNAQMQGLSEDFRSLIGNNEVEISQDLKRTLELVANIHDANYSQIDFADSELSYLTLRALADNRLKKSEAANVLIWHQQAIDYPYNGLVILPLFKPNGEWTEEALNDLLSSIRSSILPDNHPYNLLSVDKLEELRVAIQKLPPSQQVWRKFTKDLPRNRNFPRTELSLEAYKAYLSVQTGHSFDFELQLGDFSKKDILEYIIKKRRIINIPCPCLETHKKLDGNEVTASVFSGHDRTHWLLLHVYSPELIDAMLEILKIYREMTSEEQISEEIWRIADFTYIFLYGFIELINDPSLELNIALFELNFMYGDFPLLTWNLLLDMQQRSEYWQTKFGISSDKFYKLKEMNQLVKWALPFLGHHSLLEQVYLLEQLTPLVEGIEDVANFFKIKPLIPPLSIELVEYEQEDGNYKKQFSLITK